MSSFEKGPRDFGMPPLSRDIQEAMERLRALRTAMPDEREDARRQDTRAKILLGGLIVKAGLRDADKAVLMGALVSIARNMGDAEFVAEMKRRGDLLLNPHKGKA